MLRSTTKLSSVLVRSVFSSCQKKKQFEINNNSEFVRPMDKLDLAIVNLESNPELVHIFEVKAVPAIIAISSGLVVDKFVGLTDLDIIENLIQKLTNAPVNSENDKEKI
ncbi:hypothetical protein WN51_08957 [Melipona quadrifasciata]|uniref:Thioredoxin, mitochondrial n=1 Tax=Melipona quadrifasciata TaxID=166423 RepID=A0A0M8ZMZ2_9HYME|nr:hypothetical protein WN51_08957 [Melipona quadrifasciata]